MKTSAHAILLAVLCAASPSCDKPPVVPSSPPPKPSSTPPPAPSYLPGTKIPFLKIAVARNGDIQADGIPIKFEDLAEKMKALAAAQGAVLYYREPGDTQPHPDAKKIIQVVLANRLPIQLCTKPDFSDVLGNDGRAAPR